MATETYYALIQVAPTATSAEITQACDGLYDQWRRLTTHHDPKMVTQASQALQMIETIRSTLTDRDRRSVYDAAIGLNGIVGGLADPSALLQAGPTPAAAPPPMTPRGAPGRPPSTGAAPARSVWACSTCGADNPPNTRFCLMDGTQLVRACPACNRPGSLVSTGFCGECGTRYEDAIRKQREAEQRREEEARMAVWRAEQEEEARRRSTSWQRSPDGRLVCPHCDYANGPARKSCKGCYTPIPGR